MADRLCFTISKPLSHTGLLLFGYVLIVGTAPIPNSPSTEMVKFMKQFGYLIDAGPNTDALYSEKGFKEAIKDMQRFGGLPETGVIDEATQKLMTLPRCGVPDVIRKIPNNQSIREKRYVIGAEGWKKRTITYFLANWSPEFEHSETYKNLEKAFEVWTKPTPYLRFKYVRSMSADIIVAFGHGPHGDGYPFDGPGSILAHAFFPYEHGHYGGDIHFDDDELWIDESKGKQDDGLDFFTVATHEIGHSLGLAHSTVPNSVMFPYYKGYNPSFTLDYDDVIGMYELYNANSYFEDKEYDSYFNETDDTRTNSSETDETATNPSTDDDFFSERVDKKNGYNETVQKGDDGKIDENVEDDQYKMNSDDRTNSPTETTDQNDEEYSNDNDEKQTSESYFPELSPESDDVVNVTEVDDDEKSPSSNETSDNEKTYKPNACNGFFDAAGNVRNEIFIFKGLFVWRLTERGLSAKNYPIYFHYVFYGLPWSVRRIDAIYQRPTDYNIILFSDKYFWVFDGNSFTKDSPYPLTDLGLPPFLNRLDAALVWEKNGKTYFFAGNNYWRYDDRKKRMDDFYPQPIQRWRGIPPNINAAFTWNGLTYFFKANLYWRFNNEEVIVDEQYPLSASADWLGC